MYFRRYTQAIVDRANALQTITTEQYALILSFYDSDTFYIKGKEGLDILTSCLPNVQQVKYIEDQDIYSMKILEWPYLKVMCLKCAPSNPCIWKYFDEMDNEVFEYHIDQFLIFRPTPVLVKDGFDSPGHGSH